LVQPPSALPSVALADTGYYVSRGDEGTHVIVDGGPHGYQNCGHAHADALAMTVSVRGAPLLIDPGAGCYTIDADLRDRMRSTALHNTITIDDRSQSTPAGPFHWSHMADASALRWRANDGFDYFDGQHDGYGPATRHRRRVLTLHGDMILVADFIDGAAAQAALHWHLDPRWHVTIDGSTAVLSAAGDRVSLSVLGAPLEALHADVATGLGWHSPAYGRVEPTHTLRAVRACADPFWFVTVVDLNREHPIIRVDAVPIWAEAGALAHGTAVRITRTTSVDYTLVAEPNPASASETLSWRMAEFETDARVLFCRTQRDRRVTRLALVDGSFVRTPGRGGLQLVLPAAAPDLHVDLSGDARIAGPSLGARLVVNGREQPVTRERRAAPRT